MIDFNIKSMDLVILIPMLTIGMPHGAADIIMIYKKWGLLKTLIFSSLYLLLFFLGMFFWMSFSNLFFVLLWITAFFHFLDVEQQIRLTGASAYEDIMFYALFTLPVMRSHDFIEYLKTLNAESFAQVFLLLKIPIFILQVFISLYILKKNFTNKNKFFHFILYIALLFITWKLQLILSFAIIFLFIHSLRHLKLSFTRKLLTIRNYFLILMPVSVCSLLSIYLFQKWGSSITESNLFLMIGLGSLAFPHLFVERFIASK